MTTIPSFGGVFGRAEPLLRVVFFAWLATLGKITVDNLRKQKIIVVDCCCMCKEEWGNR
jgi:hypothetical protein